MRLVGAIGMVGAMIVACSGGHAESKPPEPAPEPSPAPRITAPGRIVSPTAGVSIEEALPLEEMPRHGFDLAVVTVVTADPRTDTTNANPPHLRIRIDEVLAGKVATGEHDALWSPPPSGIDWTGGDATRLRAEWAARPLAGPTAGARLIVLGHDVEGVYHVTSRLREAYSDSLRADLKRRLAEPATHP